MGCEGFGNNNQNNRGKKTRVEYYTKEGSTASFDNILEDNLFTYNLVGTAWAEVKSINPYLINNGFHRDSLGRISKATHKIKFSYHSSLINQKLYFKFNGCFFKGESLTNINEANKVVEWEVIKTEQGQ